jgi:hypothetical protein
MGFVGVRNHDRLDPVLANPAQRISRAGDGAKVEFSERAEQRGVEHPPTETAADQQGRDGILTSLSPVLEHLMAAQ